MLDIKSFDNKEPISINKGDLLECDTEEDFIIMSYKENIKTDRYALKLKRAYDIKGLHKTYKLQQITTKRDFSNFTIIKKFIKRYSKRGFYMSYLKGFLILKSGDLNLRVVV